MFDHVDLRVSDHAASERFYGTLLGAIGLPRPTVDDGFVEWNDFGFELATADRPVTRNLHVAFAAPSREAVDAFWRAGVDAGFPTDGAPGERPEYSPSYYGAFLRDPDGNSVEAVHRRGQRTDGNVDHLWLRVGDLAEARRFYGTIAPHAGIELTDETPERVTFEATSGYGGDMSIVADGGPATANVHIAFRATDDSPVQAFHAAATAAGFRDEGAPGERPVYHPGYYGAFVLDPDGNVVEVVNHRRDR